MKINWLTGILFFLLTNQVLAQNFEVISSMKGPLVVGQPFNVSFVLYGGRGGDFAPPQFKGFSVSGPSTRSEYQNINGKASQSFRWVYTLVPLKPGRGFISTASVRVTNKRLSTKNLTFDIIEPKVGTQESGQPFFRAEIPKDTFYLGEVIPLEYKLYVPYPYQKTGQRLTVPPSFEGFFVENSNYYYKEDLFIENIRYTSYVVERKYLYPHQSGTLEIPSSTIAYNVVNQNDRYGFFNNAGKTITNSSARFDVEILPLPNPEPITFTGGVGDYSFQWETENTTLSTDDIVKVRLKVEGNGDIKNIKAPDLDLEPDSFEVFPPKIIQEDKVEYRNGTMINQVIYEYLITPLKVGTYEVPIDVCYFSPDSMDYLNSNTLSLQLDVKQGQGLNIGQVPQQQSLSDELEIMTVELPAVLKPMNQNWSTHWSFWLCLLLPLGLTGSLWYKDRYDQAFGAERQAMERKSKAFHKAKKALEDLGQGEQTNTVLFTQINQVLYTYMAERFLDNQTVQSIQTVTQTLKEKKVHADLVQQMEAILKSNELLAYGMPLEESLEAHIASIIQLLQELE